MPSGYLGVLLPRVVRRCRTTDADRCCLAWGAANGDVCLLKKETDKKVLPMTIVDDLGANGISVEDERAEINAATELHTLRVKSVAQLIMRSAKDVPSQQQLREFFHNMLHAVWSQGGGTVTIDHVRRNHATKLAFIDDGPSMRPKELRDLIGQLMSSDGGIDDSRIGWGSKITGLANNRLGIEYTIKPKGEAKAIRGTLGYVESSRNFEWLKDESGEAFSETDDLPDLIKKAGHGTMVVLLGDEPTEDTFSKACGLGGATKVLARYINTRYASIPDAITVGARSQRKRSDFHKGGDLRSKRVRGMLPILESATPDGDSGTLNLPGGKVRWFVCPKIQIQKAGYRDDAAVGKTVALCLADAEVLGLLEIYELKAGDAGARALANFGLAMIAEDVTLVIEPKHVRAHSHRTQLVDTKTDSPVSLLKLATQFKEKMPERLSQLIDERAADRTAEDSDRLRKQLARFPGLIKASLLRRGKRAGLLSTPGSNGAQNHTGAVESGDSEATRTVAPSLKGGVGSGPGGRATPAPGGVSSEASDATTVAGLTMPQVVRRTNDQLSETELHRASCAGWYDATSNTLWVNRDWPGIDQELDAYLEGRKLVGPDRENARNAMFEIVIDRLSEAIVRLNIMGQVSELWSDVSSRDVALSEYGLTAVALTSLSGSREARDAIASAIGRGQ